MRGGESNTTHETYLTISEKQECKIISHLTKAIESNLWKVLTRTSSYPYSILGKYYCLQVFTYGASECLWECRRTQA